MTAKYAQVNRFFLIEEGKVNRLTPREVELELYGWMELEGFVGDDLEVLLNCADWQIRKRLLKEFEN